MNLESSLMMDLWLAVEKGTSMKYLIAAMLVFTVSCAAAQTSTAPMNEGGVFVIFNVEIKDEAKWRQYVPQAGASISDFGGELVIRGAYEHALSGDPLPHQLGGVISFPSLEAVEAWYTSDTYAPLIPLREEAAVVTQTIYRTSN